MLLRLLAAGVAAGTLLSAADLRAGAARVRVTPEQPMRMAGYGPRTGLSEGVDQDLWAKALAIEGHGGRLVIVTADVIGIPRGIAAEAARQARAACGIERERLLLNASHTHYGPVVKEHGNWGLRLTVEQARAVEEHSGRLAASLAEAACAAVKDLAPARLAFGHGSAGFAANRREKTPEGFKLGVNPAGPVDHDVPVLRVTAPDGRVRAVLFGYACHNTTLPTKVMKFSGDWAGGAQAEIEKAHPGATAMFLMLCGGDQNPEPRRTAEHSAQHGRTLAAEVNRVLAGGVRPLEGGVRAAFVETELKLAPASREELERDAGDANALKAENARQNLSAAGRGEMIRSVRFPVQAFRIGSLRLLALGGEAVVDYALRAKREFGAENLVVAGYSNDVMCYIPSHRVLREGGYEPVNSMSYYGLPGPFAPDVEERVFAAMSRAMRAVGK